ncbi:type VI secretion system baseplate subunit TssE [Pseudomonas sp. 148P]|uniref:Type VI secretion system baseplate subunit TssE n=1 Tax=Pseudomonas ulcerans TaxID=3115852 RepID=A0ABU7HUL3_9PSED|nr:MULTISPECIES: type VI secretion system baseplate subunit TssE [unclassified Pseudomonas]MEE1924012.1 type VI secretion system baseplate subunit TssE [Pseudomonas sp. 147P]MEE1935225.1 type VI secretion system baseplate subunit TssE [Pseudomonas sp. 148P]
MSRHGSLFERLNRASGPGDDLPGHASTTASVANHLARMLSTRAGSVQTLPDYGLPDFNDLRFSLHDALSQARSAIERFIEAYEPRLSQVRVTSLPHALDHLTLAFCIDGLLEIQGEKYPVHFIANLDGSGQVTLRQGAFDVR